MSLRNMFAIHPRSFVHNTYAEESVLLPTTKGTTSLKDFVHENVSELKDDTWFWTSPLRPNGHLQTIHAFTGGFQNVDHVYYGRRLITYDNGVTVSVDYAVEKPTGEWDANYSPVSDSPQLPIRTRYFKPDELAQLHSSKSETRPIAILLHGLGGGSYEPYVRTVIVPLQQRGFDCVVLNSRGCAGTNITTPQLFCGILTDDIRRYVDEILREQPSRKIYLIGFSLGACVVANYLGQEGTNSKIAAACAISCSWDLNACSYDLHSTWIGRNAYSKQVTNNLNELIKQHSAALQKDSVYWKAKDKKIELLIDFDNAYTAPFFGFNTAHEYYRAASPVNRLLNIRTPTLIINSLDDPIASSATLPYDEVRANPYCFMTATDVGGHLAWFLPSGKRWYADVVTKFLQAVDTKVDTSKEIIDNAELLESKFIDGRLVD